MLACYVSTYHFSLHREVGAAWPSHTESIHYQSTPDELVQDTLRRGEGCLSDSGALVIQTGEFTGRSPKDKFTVRDETTECDSGLEPIQHSD